MKAGQRIIQVGWVKGGEQQVKAAQQPADFPGLSRCLQYRYCAGIVDIGEHPPMVAPVVDEGCLTVWGMQKLRYPDGCIVLFFQLLLQVAGDPLQVGRDQGRVGKDGPAELLENGEFPGRKPDQPGIVDVPAADGGNSPDFLIRKKEGGGLLLRLHDFFFQAVYFSALSMARSTGYLSPLMAIFFSAAARRSTSSWSLNRHR